MFYLTSKSVEMPTMHCPFCLNLISNINPSICHYHIHKPKFFFSNLKLKLNMIFYSTFNYSVKVFIDDKIELFDRNRDNENYSQIITIPYFLISPDSLESDVNKILKLKAFL